MRRTSVAAAFEALVIHHLDLEREEKAEGRLHPKAIKRPRPQGEATCLRQRALKTHQVRVMDPNLLRARELNRMVHGGAERIVRSPQLVGIRHGGHSLTQLAGLSRRSPWLGGALLVFLLSLAGIPFVVGFWSKLFLFLAAWRAGETVLVLLAVSTAVIGLFYYLSVARSTFMSDGSNPAPVRPAAGVSAAIALCLLAVVGFGLWPAPLVDAAVKAAAGVGVGP